jgi:hypothetical protein
MRGVKVVQESLIRFEADGYTGWVEVRVRDIGFTIGTEILDHEGGRLVAYRPGTRYGSYAEELAAGHLKAALTKVDTDSPGFRVRDFWALLKAALQEIVDADGAGPWSPDGEAEEGEW